MWGALNMLGGEGGNVGVVTKESLICEWVFSLNLIMYFYTGVLLVSWLQIYGDLNVG
jgi:hypothetical protein